MAELTRWCRAHRFSDVMTDAVVNAFGDLDSLRSCANNLGFVNEGLEEQKLPSVPHKYVVAAIRALAEPGAAPPPAAAAAAAPSPEQVRGLAAGMAKVSVKAKPAKAPKVELSPRPSAITREHALPKLMKENDVVKGTVTGVEAYGVFVRIDDAPSDASSGLVHKSELADDFVKDVASRFAKGDRVVAKVLKIEQGSGKKKVSLGLKPSYFKKYYSSKLTELRTLRGHRNKVNCVAVFPDGRRVVSCDGSVSRVRRALLSYDPHGNLPTDKPGVVKVWEVATGRCVATLEGHSKSVECVAVFPDGRRVVSASYDNTLKVWDVETGECVATLQGHKSGVLSVAVFPDGRRVVSGSDDKTLKVWDVETGECVATLLQGHKSRVKGVAVFPDGRRVVSGSEWTFKVWDVATGECVATLGGSNPAVFPDGRRVVSASLDKTLKVWDVETGKCVATLEGHSDIVQCVAVFPDGRRVVSCDGALRKPGVVKVWDVATGKCVATLKGYTDDPKTWIADIYMGEVVNRVEGHYSYVLSVAVFPDGRRVVSGSDDKTLMVHELHHERLERQRRGFLVIPDADEARMLANDPAAICVPETQGKIFFWKPRGKNST